MMSMAPSMANKASIDEHHKNATAINTLIPQGGGDHYQNQRCPGE
jgi:hypothetical protein